MKVNLQKNTKMGSIGSLVIDPRQIVKPIDDKQVDYLKRDFRISSQPMANQEFLSVRKKEADAR
jgi:hypothetical protein